MLTLHAAVGAGAHDAQEVVVAGAREGDDHAVDALPGDDRVEVAQGADHRQRRTLVAVVPRLAVVEEADEVDAVLGVAGDLGGHGVADLAGADDEHPLLERRPRPDGDPADPAGDRHDEDGDGPEGDQRDDRRLVAEREHQDDEQHPARGRERGQAGQPLAEVEAADAAPRLAVEAEGPQRREPVGRQEDEEQTPTGGSLSNAPFSCWISGTVVEARDDPDREHRRRQQPHRVCRHGGDDAQAGRPARPRAGPAPGRGSAARTSLFEGPVSHVSCIGNTFGKHKRWSSLTARESRQLAVPPLAQPPLKARKSR